MPALYMEEEGKRHRTECPHRRQRWGRHRTEHLHCTQRRREGRRHRINGYTVNEKEEKREETQDRMPTP